MRYFKNTSWLLLEKILRMSVGLFISVWVARYLGPEQFGLFSYALSFVGLFAAIAILGLDGIVVRELLKDENKRDEIIGTVFGLRLVGALLLILILVIAVVFTSNDGFTNLLIFIIASGVVFQSFNVVDLYFQSRVMSKYVVYANIITLFLSSVVKITLILNNAPLLYFACVVLFDSIILASGYIYFYLHNHLTFRTWRFNRVLGLELLKDSWPLILSGLIVSVYLKIDQVMIKEMLGNEMVGQYAAAVKLSEVWHFIPVIISSSLFPAILNAKEQNEDLYYSRIQKLFSLMIWLAIAIAVPLTLLSDWLVTILYGEKYGLAGNVLAVHVWAGVFVFLGVASGRWYLAENLQKQAFWRAFCGMVVNIVLNYFLIEQYGLIGAAVATLTSQVVAAYLFDAFGRRTRRIFIVKTKAFYNFRFRSR